MLQGKIMHDANRILRKSLEGRLKNASANMQAAKSRIGDHDYRRAVQFAAKACIIDEHNIEARYIKGFCHQILGEFTKAADTYRKIISMIPGSAVAHLYLADCLQKAGRPEEAIQYYLESMDLDCDGDVRELAMESVVMLKESL